MTTTTKTKAEHSGVLVELTPAKIILGHENVRRDVGDITDLAESIAQHGLISPLRVDAEHRLVSGHRRLAAIKSLIEQKRWAGPIPCMEVDTDDTETLVTMLIENLQRVDLDPVEEAFGFQRLAVTHGMKAADIATAVNRSATHVRERIALCTLPEQVLANVSTGKMKVADALLLTKLDEDRLTRLLKAHPVPTSFNITDAFARQQKAKKENPVRKLLKDAGFKIDTFVQNRGELNHASVTVDELAGRLDKIPSTRTDKVAVLESYTEPMRISLYWSMTDGEKAKREAEIAKTRTAAEQERAEWAQQQEARFTDLLATVPPELQAWYHECARLTDEYEQRTDALTGQVDNATAQFLHDASTKDIAAVALQYVASNLLSNMAWRMREPEAADFITGVLDIAEADLEYTETRAIDWRRSVAKKPIYLTRAAALALHFQASSTLTNQLNAFLATHELLVEEPKFPQPPTFEGISEIGIDDFEFSDVVDYIEMYAHGRLEITTEPESEEDTEDDDAADAAA